MLYRREIFLALLIRTEKKDGKEEDAYICGKHRHHDVLVSPHDDGPTCPSRQLRCYRWQRKTKPWPFSQAVSKKHVLCKAVETRIFSRDCGNRVPISEFLVTYLVIHLTLSEEQHVRYICVWQIPFGHDWHRSRNTLRALTVSGWKELSLIAMRPLCLQNEVRIYVDPVLANGHR